MSRELVLLTTNHPFTFTGGETMFVGPELPHLARAFDALRIVPLHDSGQVLALPDGVTLDRGLAQRWRRGRLLHLLAAPLWPGFWPELWRGARHGGWVGAARVWRWAAVADATWAWLRSALTEASPTLLYSYWRGGQTLAATRWADAHPGSAAVTRVHRYELYDEAFSPPFQPWTQVYQRLARVIAIAQHGADHLREVGVAGRRVQVARLGVAAAPRRNLASSDGVLRVVSCSNVIPLKRVALVAQALCELALRLPQRRITWTHFGSGPALRALQAGLQSGPPNLAVHLAGQVPNARVLAHYASQPVDLLVLLSRSEGLPVSIQEALAHGIPVLATDVGGVAEAVDVSGENGALLPVDAPLAVIVDALAGLLLAPADEIAARRDAAWRRWARDFDAERNHAELATSLAALAID